MAQQSRWSCIFRNTRKFNWET